MSQHKLDLSKGSNGWYRINDVLPRLNRRGRSFQRKHRSVRSTVGHTGRLSVQGQLSAYLKPTVGTSRTCLRWGAREARASVPHKGLSPSSSGSGTIRSSFDSTKTRTKTVGPSAAPSAFRPRRRRRADEGTTEELGEGKLGAESRAGGVTTSAHHGIGVSKPRRLHGHECYRLTTAALGGRVSTRRWDRGQHECRRQHCRATDIGTVGPPTWRHAGIIDSRLE